MGESNGLLNESEDLENLVSTEDELEAERKNITLWRSPLKTFYYFGWQTFDELCKGFKFAKLHKLNIAVTAGVTLAILLFLNIPGAQQKYVVWLNKEIWWSVWWVGLGILSTVGLGTGLHTFILYLGPHIAQVTMAAWECKSVEFPEPPYPDVVICPPEGTSLMHVDMWVIMSKVRWESLMWGIGTAIGELPPYFMARAARLSGNEMDDSSYTDLQRVKDPSTLKWGDRFKRWIQNFVQSAGFIGILICASMVCVVILFTADNLKLFGEKISHLPLIGPALHGPFTEYMEQQRITLHGSSANHIQHSPTVISIVFNVFVGLMLLFFLVSIIHGTAQQKFRTLNKSRLPLKEEKRETSHLLDKQTDEQTDKQMNKQTE
ncbi:vacuole membrane protein 1-like isoform X2 [Bolinopsis microptera]|uniref:vacuole membrane protein 1-like isoform X2 n=1 Tax=Bolinopsis microptera TaxID=2820187 RepID=UPI003078DA6F